MEVDFNFSSKLIYGVRMMDNVRKYGYMPEEICSEKGKTADECCFTALRVSPELLCWSQLAQCYKLL